MTHRITAKALRQPLPAIPRILPRNVSREVMLSLTNARVVNKLGTEVPMTQEMIDKVLLLLHKSERA